MSAYGGLSRYRQIFVDHVVRGLDGTEAVKQAGFKGRRPDIAASKLRSLPQVKQAIEERTEAAIAKSGVNIVRVLEGIAQLAHYDPRKLVDKDGKYLPLQDLPDDVAMALASLEVEELADGKTRIRKYRLHHRLEPYKVLGQYMKLWVERHELTGKDGGPIKTQEMNDLEKARRIAFLLEQGLRAAAIAAPATPLSQPASDDNEV